LRLLPGSLPRRCHRRRAEFRVRCGNARGTLLRQGQAARERRPLGARDREEPLPRRAVPVRPAMSLSALFFYLFAIVAVASAFMVIASRNPVHSVLFLVLAFVNAAGLFHMA